MKRIAVVAALAAGFIAPVAAHADEFRGQSQQRQLVVLTTRPDGEARRFSIRWKTQDCTKGGRMTPRWTSFVRPLERSKPGSFADQGAFTTHYSDATVRFVTSVRGTLRSNHRWRGTFKIKASIDRPGGVSNRCRLGPIAWSARQVRG